MIFNSQIKPQRYANYEYEREEFYPPPYIPQKNSRIYINDTGTTPLTYQKEIFRDTRIPFFPHFFKSRA